MSKGYKNSSHTTLIVYDLLPFLNKRRKSSLHVQSSIDLLSHALSKEVSRRKTNQTFSLKKAANYFDLWICLINSSHHTSQDWPAQSKHKDKYNWLRHFTGLIKGNNEEWTNWVKFSKWHYYIPWRWNPA